MLSRSSMKTKIKTGIKSEEWLHFSWAFLDVAEFSCDFWLNAVKKREYSGKTSVRSYLAIIFNIKHSLELFLKRCIVSYTGNLDKKDYGHDLESFYEKFLQIDFQKIQTAIKSKPESLRENHPLFVARHILSKPKSLQKKVDTLGDLVDRYYHLRFSRNFKKVGIILRDVENTAFRYPENSLAVDIDYLDLIERISFADFNDLREDITLLTWCYSNLGFVIRQYEGVLQSKVKPL